MVIIGSCGQVLDGMDPKDGMSTLSGSAFSRYDKDNGYSYANKWATCSSGWYWKSDRRVYANLNGTLASVDRIRSLYCEISLSLGNDKTFPGSTASTSID